MNTKICTKCGEEKAATGELFYKQEDGKYGLTSRCKVCKKVASAKWRQENPEKERARISKWRQENPDKEKARISKWSQENPEKIKAINAKWQRENPEKIKEKSAKRRADKLKQTPGYANLELIKKIYKHCPEGYHVDHMIPLANGGVHYESNLCYLPAGINTAKGAKSIEEFGLDVFNHHVIYWQDVLSQE